MTAAAERTPCPPHAIDTPQENAAIDGNIRISGWCLAVDDEPRAIRVRSGQETAPATMGIARLDVAAAFPGDASAATSGFQATLQLPAGDHRIAIEARCGDDQWYALGARQVVVRAPSLRASLDTPTGMHAEKGPIRFSGWCAHPQWHIADLRLAIGAAHVPCQYGLERPDVGAALSDVPDAARSGFEALTEVNPGTWPVRLIAVLENATEAVYEFPQPLRVRAEPVLIRLMHFLRMGFGLLRYGFRQARAWIADNRRLPRPHELPRLLRIALEQYRHNVATNPVSTLPTGYRPPETIDRYAAWQLCNQFTAAARADLERRLSATRDLPRLSVVMPVYNPPLEYLTAAIDSVLAQVYSNWELCIADDASTLDDLGDYLRRLAATEPRVRLCFRDANGNISRATNSAAELATGEFLVFLDQDDLLTPDALAEIALCSAVQPDADIIYSDDDKIDISGHRFAPQFKPQWSPELLLGYMYFSHVFSVRRAIYEKIGGMRIGFEGSQDYDFALRASESARAIAHIPQVLYHWRVLPGSTAASGAAKPASFEAGRRAVQDALDRRGMHGQAQQPDWARKAAVGVFGVVFPDDGPKVSIIIPTRNGLDILRRCIESLRLTTYGNYEVIVVDNGSDDPATLDYLAGLTHRVERIANPHGRFNYAYINNRAAERVDGELLLFLNNDTEVIESRWLSQMVGYAAAPGVGTVGARLLYPDQRVQHAGIVHGYYRGVAGPAFKLAPAWDNGYLSYARVARNYSAVTAACMLTPRATFIELGGFDEQQFEVAYNDVDYCYRLGERGLRSVYCADAELLHYEGHSRGFLDRPQEIANFRRKYTGKQDPYYSPHLSLDDERFAINPRRYRIDGKMPVRALMCAFNLNWEGAPYSQLELTLGMKRQGYIDPQVFAPKDGPLRAAYEQAGIPVHLFEHPLTGVHDEGAYDRAIDGFGNFIRELGVDVVYGNTLQTFFAIDAAHRQGLPTVWNPRESEPWQTYFSFLPKAVAIRALGCFAHPYRVIFVAEATRKVWAPLESYGNFSVIHNGLDLTRLLSEAARYPRSEARRALGIADGEIALLLPGTVCERKGQHDLVKALALLQPSTMTRTRCFIIGDRANNYSMEMHALVAALPAALRGHVSIVPEAHDIVRYYQASDVFICTSRIESFPRVVLEAMAFGLPIVSTRVFGIAEQVQENINAMLYDPGDVARLAMRLEQIINDRDARERLASNSPHVLATLNTFDEMVAAYGQVFREAALLRTQPLADDTVSKRGRLTESVNR